MEALRVWCLADIEPWIPRIKRVFTEWNVKIDLSRVEIIFMDRENMPGLMGVYTRKGKGKRAKRVIVLRRGVFLPRAIAVLAHELVHMWVDTCVRGGYPVDEIEGFCDFVAYKLLVRLGFPPIFAARGGVYKKQLTRYLSINQFMSTRAIIESFARGRKEFFEDVSKARREYVG